MHTPVAIFSALLIGTCMTACATTNATTGTPVPQTAAAPAAPTRSSGYMVVRKPLVEVGTTDLLLPVVVPADAAAATARTPGVATAGPSASRCEDRAGGVRVTNATEFPAALEVDGEPVVTMGEASLLRFIGPRTSVSLCLDPSKSHVFEGFALRAWDGRLFAIPNTFRSEVAMATDGPVTYVVSYARIAGGQ